MKKQGEVIVALGVILFIILGVTAAIQELNSQRITRERAMSQALQLVKEERGRDGRIQKVLNCGPNECEGRPHVVYVDTTNNFGVGFIEKVYAGRTDLEATIASD